jgi:deazaflavin-dependent oxidoreductase (nitroreductase family)
MTSIWIKFFTMANIFVYQKTNGRLGSRMGGQSVLLLHTIGRRSGRSRTTSLSFYRDGNTYLLVASNWGKETNPDWYPNLLKNTRSTIQVGGNTIPVEARPAQSEEYARLWELVTNQNTQYIQYQKSMKRQMPIVILTPIPPT